MLNFSNVAFFFAHEKDEEGKKLIRKFANKISVCGSMLTQPSMNEIVDDSRFKDCHSTRFIQFVCLHK